MTKSNDLLGDVDVMTATQTLSISRVATSSDYILANASISSPFNLFFNHCTEKSSNQRIPRDVYALSKALLNLKLYFFGGIVFTRRHSLTASPCDTQLQKISVLAY